MAHSELCNIRQANGGKCDGAVPCDHWCILGSISEVRITRTRIFPEHFRPAGASAAWHWTYNVHCEGTCDVSCARSRSHGVGRGLRNARDVAARIASRLNIATVREDWVAGNKYAVGPRGGLQRAS